MHLENLEQFLSPKQWFQSGHGPRYRQLSRYLQTAITDGTLTAGTQIPPERDIAKFANVSRVTVRNAMSKLIQENLIAQKQGSGSYVRELPAEHRLEQSLSSLTSFTEYMEQRGFSSSSIVLSHGIHRPTPNEMLILGLSPQEKVARVQRLRSADNTPLALETSSLPVDILPNTASVDISLYKVLRASGNAPVRAIQRINANNVSAQHAELLQVTKGTAVLQIDRTAYLDTGRPIELTSGFYRSDVYEFVAELRLEKHD